ncbi:hypothetical protein SAMN04515671_3723 [Nakamurella panacisegetis]|uniref:Uncharacterized protein n=1 Tax=Nakamurella panacisegetis TaxID=1090615 RepID=A0A1H0RS71_9ACTN|nr:hypothetical protein SAMN04515671_3723 [Nakamurella panacisegetis]
MYQTGDGPLLVVECRPVRRHLQLRNRYGGTL